MKTIFTRSLFESLVATVLMLTTLSVGFAQVRTSTNYELQSDSINIGGGLSSSSAYRQESTVGEVATGQSTSTTYQLRAGYQQMQAVYLSLTAATDVILTPNLPGLTGGTSNGSTTVTVTTDSPAGYSMTIESQNSPAMQNDNSDFIDDYNHGAEPDFTFTTPAATAHFGFSPAGVDVAALFKDNGSACNVGALETAGACWAGLSTSPLEIVLGSGSNHPNGATTTVFFRVGISAGAAVPSGLYTATTTLTALPL